MNKINSEWHRANKMPKNPTFDQRMQWHAEHQKFCNCRTPSRELAEQINEWMKKEKALRQQPQQADKPGNQGT